MDVWRFDDDNNHSCSSSSGSFPPIQFDGYWSSFSSIDDDYAAGIFHDEGGCHIELGDSELQGQLDELKMLMESIDSTGQVSEDMIFEYSQTENFNHNSSLQIHNQPSLPSSNRACSIDSSSSNYMMNEQRMQPLSSAPLTNQHCDARFLAATMEDIAITKAMLTVISSSSSSSSSSPSCMKKQQQRTQTCHHPMSAFEPYSSSVPPVMMTHKNVQSQNMIKRAHNILRSVNSLKDEEKQEETQPSAYQMQHMVSERKRRERLNASFHSLWQLLPPGSKKDKTSVLCKTMSYVRTLKAEVYELEEKNRVLEEHVLPSVEDKEQFICPSEKIQVQISKSSVTTSEMQQIDLVIMVRVQCDLIRVVLHVLECIKAMNAISLLSLDASPSSQQMNLFATLKLAIMGSTWDERTFREAVIGAAHMALTVTASTFPAFAVLDF